MIPRIALALVVILWCSFAEARVVIYRSRTTIVYSDPAVTTYVAPAPVVTYVAPPVVTYSAPATSLLVEAGPTGAQRRHARKAAEHARKAAYWASRS